MMKKRWLLLCLLLLLSGCTQQSVEKMPEEPPVTVGESTPGAPMPENEAELPALSADLEELNRVHTPALYAMGGYGSWDDPTVMRPDSFVDYYQYLLSAQPELEEDAGIYTDEDKLRRMVPQESLEQLVCPRFGVSEERVREILRDVLDECRENDWLLRRSAEGCRSPAVAELAGAQRDYARRTEEILREEMPRLMAGDDSPGEERAEAAALYAEYAMDFAAQSMRGALAAALTALDLQMDWEEERKEESV